MSVKCVVSAELFTPHEESLRVVDKTLVPLGMTSRSTTIQEKSVLVSVLGIHHCNVDFGAGRIFTTALLAERLLRSHYPVERHTRELVRHILFAVSFKFLSIDDHFSFICLSLSLVCLHALIDAFEAPLSALRLRELLVLYGHRLQDLNLGFLHLLVVVAHLSTHGRWKNAGPTFADDVPVVGVLTQLLPALDLVRIDLGKSIRRDASPRVLNEVVIRNGHVHLLSHVIVAVFRKDVVEKTHIVENFLAIDDGGLLALVLLVIHGGS